MKLETVDNIPKDLFNKVKPYEDKRIIVESEATQKKQSKKYNQNKTRFTDNEKKTIDKKYIQLFNFCIKGDLTKLKNFIEKNQHLNLNYVIPERHYIPKQTIDFAYQFGHIHIVKFFLEETAVYFDLNPLLIDSVAEGDLDTVQYLIENYNISQGDKTIVDGFKTLMEKGSLRTEIGTNELLCQACTHGHLHIVRYLLTKTQEHNRPNINRFGIEPLKTACSFGHLEIVQYLLESDELEENANISLDYDTFGHLHLLGVTFKEPKESKETRDIRDTFIFELGHLQHNEVDRSRFKVCQILKWLVSEYKHADELAIWFAQKPELKRYMYLNPNYIEERNKKHTDEK